MNASPNHPRRVVILGGGITGLAAAHRLTELLAGCELVMLEAGSRLGGVLETVEREGFLIERSADSFTTVVPWALDFCRRIGFADQLISTASQQRSALVVCRGKLERVPQGFMLMAPERIGPLLSTPILSPLGKLRLLAEYFVPPAREQSDESLAAFARRRLGRETFERIVQPLVGGIYAADPEKLSLEATLPRFLEMEREAGGLIRGARAKMNRAASELAASEAGARYGMFVAPRRGMSSLVEAAATRLPAGCVRLGCRVERIEPRAGGGWTVHAGETLECDAVIVATSPAGAASCVVGFDAELARQLAAIESAGTAIVSLGFGRDQVQHPLDGFGFVVPAVEKRQIIAASFSSVKFAGRAPEGAVLVRVFIGGALQSELVTLPDDQLRAIAVDELRSLLGVRGESRVAEIARWPHAMPQYHLGHTARIAEIESAAARWPGLALAGNAFGGVGIPQCIRSGELAAERILAALT